VARRKRQRKVELAEVLSGKLSLDSDELLRLIAEINPTGRDLPEGQTRERYRHKSRCFEGPEGS